MGPQNTSTARSPANRPLCWIAVMAGCLPPNHDHEGSQTHRFIVPQMPESTSQSTGASRKNESNTLGLATRRAPGFSPGRPATPTWGPGRGAGSVKDTMRLPPAQTQTWPARRSRAARSGAAVSVAVATVLPKRVSLAAPVSGSRVAA